MPYPSLRARRFARSFGLAALTAATLLLSAPVISTAPAAAQGTVMPVQHEVKVPTAVSSAPAFAIDWTVSMTPKASEKLMEMVQGHTEVRRMPGENNDAKALSLRSETRIIADYYGNRIAKPEPVTAVFKSGNVVAYNSVQNTFIRETPRDSNRLPYSLTPWQDDSGGVMDFVQGKFWLGEDARPKDEMLDGVPVRVYVNDTGNVDMKGPNGKVIQTFRSLTKYYYAKQTGLPVRRASFSSKDNGPLVETSRLDIKACKPLPSLSDDRFALEIPATAKAWEAPRMPPMLTAGTQAPDFSCIGSDGKTMKLSDLRGKIVILDFWATWCGPCQLSFPHLQSVYEATKGRGDVAVLALCVRDEKALYEKWRVTHREDYTFPVAFDPAAMAKDKSIPYKAYNVGGIPTQYIIGKDGKIVGSLIGYGGENDHRLEAELAKVGITLPTEIRTASAH